MNTTFKCSLSISFGSTSLGEEKTIDLTFPENYHVDDLKGAKVQFKVKIKELKERISNNSGSAWSIALLHNNKLCAFMYISKI